LHQVGDLFELNVKLRCQKLNARTTPSTALSKNVGAILHLPLLVQNPVPTIARYEKL
jgi:hypothetical protein